MAKAIFSVMLQLRPVAPMTGQIEAGYQVHAAFLDLIRQADPLLSQQLHDMNQRKPFTVSPLLGPGRNSPGVYRLRLTSLEASIFEAFISCFLNPGASSLKLRLGAAMFEVVRIEGSSAGNEWVGRSSFEQLAMLPPASGWHFQFASPTAFSLGEQDWGGRKFAIFPEPGLVFDSLANRWAAFAPPGLPSLDLVELRQYVEKYVVVTGFSGQSEVLPLKHHSQLGFVGSASYRVLEKQPSPEYTAILNTLAAFALYAGVGYKTTMGLGQVRAIANQVGDNLKIAPGEKVRV